MEKQTLFILLVSSIASLISFIVVIVLSSRQSRKMINEMHERLWEKYKKK